MYGKVQRPAMVEHFTQEVYCLVDGKEVLQKQNNHASFEEKYYKICNKAVAMRDST